jgi:nucleoside-diphosphate-sugar epimerase
MDVMAVDRKPRERWYQTPHDVRSFTDTSVRELVPANLSGIDEVYHLAADMGGIGYITHNLVSCSRNVVDTINLLDCVHPDTLVFFSSSACVYPVHMQEKGGNVSLAEHMVWPYDPEPGYGFEKLYGEQLMKWYHEERDVQTRVARYHNVYGPHGSWNDGREKAPAAICRKVAIAKLTGEHTIDIWGDGEQTRSFMYVDDCVEGTKLITRDTRPDAYEPVNLGTEDWVTINELVSIVEQIAGVHLRRRYDLTAPQGVRGRNSDNTLIAERLGWEPKLTLEYGLEKTYHWVYDQVKAAAEGS